MRWTGEQKNAISRDTGNGNLLVSAAAGSGKTAVLVERVLQKILKDKSSVDRLLIVTFTEAAASEMREKIIKRLRDYILNGECAPDIAKKIKEQIRLVETADIMTIDAFCYRVVQNNFYALGIDPDIRICDSSMVKLLQSEAIDNLFRRLYKDDSKETKERFNRLTEFYAQDRNNDNLEKLILLVYTFAESFSDPLEWVKNCVEDYKKPIEEWQSIKYQIAAIKDAAKECLYAVSTLTSDDDISPEAENFADYLKSICSEIINAEDWDSIYDVYKSHLKTKKQLEKSREEIDNLPLEKEQTQLSHAFFSLADIFSIIGITKPFDDIKSSYIPELLIEEAEDIAWIVEEFHKDYSALKEKRGVYEFADIEHLTYNLFRSNEFVREAYKNKYDEILIDEYQDTNMLQDSIFEIISHDNIFMVGDLKQSIYRFRKGDPYIFKGKSEGYSCEDVPHNKIVLSQNFRSRQSILNGVNDIFSKIMSKTAGDINYRGDELITRQAEHEYYPESTLTPKSELYYLAVDRDSGPDLIETEAKFTAQKIYELLNTNATVYDKSTGTMRPIMKKDIVILQSSVKKISKLLTEELSRLGIDSYADKSSFFDRREIVIILSLLSVINNAHQDIPLITVMRSPIWGFTDDELAKIRINKKTSRFFIDAVKEYSETGDDESLARRTGEVISNIRRWRQYIRRKSVAQLIWAIYEESCFYDIMGAIESSDEAQTNLRLLYERAKSFEGAGFKGLFNFIKYIDELKDDKFSELSGAKQISDNQDVVRIMTIHKSKGLEFPVVFLLGTGSDFRVAQDSPALRLHKTLGFGLSHIYYDRHFARNTYAKALIENVNHTEGISEQMRLLYVALTRAREKLYVVASKKASADETEESQIEKWESALVGNKFIPSESINAKGFHSWLFPAALASPDTWEVHYVPIAEEIVSTEFSTDNESITTYESDELRDVVYSLLDYSYPYKESNVLPSRTSVTQLKELALERIDDEVSYEPTNRTQADFDGYTVIAPLEKAPRFMEDNAVKPANEIGTLYHLVMSNIDLNTVRAQGDSGVETELDRMVDEGIVSSNDIKYIDEDKIKTFFHSVLGKRMLNSDNVRREEPFQINISALEYDPSLPKEYENETVILQGIIDCFFETDKGYVLFDYKTDKVKDKTDIRRKYEKQLNLYAEAIEKLTNTPVCEKYLYLFDTGEIV